MARRRHKVAAATGRNISILTVAALVIGAVSWNADAAPAIEQVPVNILVTDGRFAESGEPALAVNPRNPQDLLGATQDINSPPGPAPGSFVSFNGGASWSDRGLLPLPAGDHIGGDATVAFDRAGSGFVLSHTGRGSFNVNRVVLWKTTDGGRRFSQPTILFNGDGVIVDHPSLAIDTSHGRFAGAIYAVWTAGAPARFPSHSHLFFTRSTDGGKTFSRPRTIAELPGRYPAVPVANVDGSGNLHILFTVGSGDPYHPPFRPLSRLLVGSSDGGVRFGSPQLLTHEPIFLPLHGITTANIGALAAGKGLLFVALAGRRRDRTDILVWRSDHNGQSWQGPTAISSPDGAAAESFQPQLAVSPNGAVYVSYLAIRDRRVNVYLTRSTNNGSTFEASRRISSMSFDPRYGDKTRSPAVPWLGDYQALAAGPSTIHAVWTDTRRTKMGLFAASLPAR